MMSKKKYIKPQIMALEIESQQILAGSESPKLNLGNDADYEEEQVSNWRDSEGGIWAD